MGEAGGPPERKRVPQKHGGVLALIPKGVSGNPGGLPKGFVKPTAAYAACAGLSVEDLKLIRAGRAPKGWKWGSPVSSVYSMAAGQILAATGAEGIDGVPKANATSAMEIVDRLEGKVAQKHEFDIADVEKIAALLGVDAAALKVQAERLMKVLAK